MDSLKTYRERRHFKRTPEPRGRKAKTAQAPIFVVQKHDASRVHFDLRLEIDGVLKSWSVPKGPSTDPRVKRLAIPTEDHPLEYAGFEGVIPEDEYGGGTVMVWDAGTYRNLKPAIHDHQMSMKQGLDRGEVTFWLNGKKLKGGYALVRIRKSPEQVWLLIKMRDAEAHVSPQPVVTAKKSALSGRTMDEIAEESR